MISLIVLRVSDIEKSKHFFEQLQLNFIKEQHGSSVEHYSSQLNSLVLELYPATPCYPVEKSTRLGFSLPNLEEIINNLKNNGYENHIVKDLCFHNNNIYALVTDPDGRKIELHAV